MKEVKVEKFGSRASILKKFLVENAIDFVSNIWMLTCRKSVNTNVKSRYLIIIEGDFSDQYTILLEKLHVDIPIITAVFDNAEQNLTIHNIKTHKKGVVSINQFKQRLIDVTMCKFIPSSAKGSKAATPLSRFFREHMGKGFALTDIDFFLTQKALFVEEKTFLKNNMGYIGVGQCISFKEIQTIFNRIDFLIVCISHDEFYIENLNEVHCKHIEIIDGWGKMVAFKPKKISRIELIQRLK